MRRRDVIQTSRLFQRSEDSGAAESSTAALVIVAAVDELGGTGRSGKLPWCLPQDLAWFRALTLGGTLAMGRQTYEDCAPRLDGRLSVMLSKDPERIRRGACPSLRLLVRSTENPVFACGGTEVWREAVALADEGYRTAAFITLVEGAHDCDTFFPHTLEELGLRGLRPVFRTAWRSDRAGGPRSAIIQLINF